MDDTSLQERKDMIDLRDQALAELSAVASQSDPDKAHGLTSWIRTLSNQIERIPKPAPTGKYVMYQVATHVLVEHLKEAGHAMRVPDLIEAILAEGYLGGGDRGRTSLRKALGSFATGRGTISGTIKIDGPEFDRLGKLKDGWAWLGEWAEPRIKTQ